MTLGGSLGQYFMGTSETVKYETLFYVILFVGWRWRWGGVLIMLFAIVMTPLTSHPDEDGEDRFEEKLASCAASRSCSREETAHYFHFCQHVSNFSPRQSSSTPPPM